MKARRSTRFDRDYSKAPKEVQTALDKQVQLLLHDLRHPSLHAKKYDEGKDLRQARVTGSWRFYFTIIGDIYYLVRLRSHPK